MKHRTALVAALTVTAALGITGPARADDPNADHRPCVSKREYNSLHIWTQQNLEARWEVTGRGLPMSTSGVDITVQRGDVGIIYPRCGYPIGDAWYAVLYQRRGQNLWADYGISMKLQGAEPDAPE